MNSDSKLRLLMSEQISSCWYMDDDFTRSSGHVGHPDEEVPSVYVRFLDKLDLDDEEFLKRYNKMMRYVEISQIVV